MNTYIFWIIFILVNVIAECMTHAITNMWFAIGGIVGLILAALGIPFLPQLIVAVMVSVFCLLVLRNFVKEKFNRERISTNVTDGIVGTKGVALSDFAEGKGKIQINNMKWSARSEDTISKGDRVIVRELSGVTLRVEKL